MLRRNALTAFILASVVAAASLAAGPARAQMGIDRVWDIALGTPVANLSPQFTIQACGTNGGPPRQFIEGFADFAKCAPEPGTGLHEVWFSYDDEEEYYHKAMRAPDIILDTYRANVLFEQLMIFSLLIDDAGTVQGYRIVSDPREIPARRIIADSISFLLRLPHGGALGWDCEDLPAKTGEEPFAGEFKKELCTKVANNWHITLETHRFLKVGQRAGRPGAPGINEFEVNVRLEAVNAALVGN